MNITNHSQLTFGYLMLTRSENKSVAFGCWHSLLHSTERRITQNYPVL